MTITTEDYYEVDGQALNTFAWNIETIGKLDAPPAYRGTDLVIPYARGERWVPKVVGARIIPFSMWVRGMEADGSIPTSQKNTYDDNWRTLRNLLWQPGKQFSLKKHFKVGGVSRSATATAEYAGGLDTSMLSRTGAKFEVDLKLTDPYYYDDVATNIDLSNGDQNVTVVGDDVTNHITITLNGERVNPTLLNKTNDYLLQYQDTLASGDVAQIIVQDYTSVTDPSGITPPWRSTGKLQHSGGPELFLLKNGLNVVNLSSTSGTGAVNLLARGAWL